MKAKYRITIFIVIIAYIFASHTALATNVAINDARSSVVRVVAEHADYSRWTGSAFIIAHSGTTSFLVTNLQVISSSPQKIWIVMNDTTGTIVEATPVHLDEGLDLAILTTNVGLSARPILPLSGLGTVEAAQEVYALGFSTVLDYLLDNIDRLPSRVDDVTVTRGVVSRTNVFIDRTEVFESDVYLDLGNSGGPMLDANGVVRGVNTWKADGRSYSIHISYIIQAAQELDIPINIVGVKKTIPTWMIAALTAAVVLLLAGIVFAVRKRKQQKAVAVAGQVELVRLPMETAPVQRLSAGAPVIAKADGIRGTGGQYNTMSFPVPDRALVGRDPERCSIVFAAHTNGVSALHCEITRVDTGLQICDRGSSYGTFLGETKLTVNVPVDIKPGDTFYLGDKRNSFVVY